MFSKLTVHGEELPLNQKYDDIHEFPHFRASLVRIFDDEEGLRAFWTDDEHARLIGQTAMLRIAICDGQTQQETEGYIQFREDTFDFENHINRLTPEPYEILSDGEIVNVDHGED